MRNRSANRSFLKLFKALTKIVTLVLFCLAAQATFAQIDQGRITGSITDQTGRAIQGASVTVVNNDTNLSLTRLSADDGTYTFSPIKIGVYTLTVSAPNFETRKQENIRVDVSQVVSLNFSLKPGAVNEVITVTSTSELQLEDASTGQVFTKSQLEDLPLLDRNYLFLAALATGVNAPNQGNTQTSGSGAFSSNGSRVSQNNFILDGVDNNSNMQDFLNGATYAVRPPPEARQSSRSRAAITAQNLAERPERQSMRRSRREPTRSTEPFGNTCATTA